MGYLGASFCRMARRGGVERISGLIYEEVWGVMKVFMEVIIHDAVLFAQYTHRKTVTPIDIIFALKQHGRNVYGFTHPYSYSKKVGNLPPRE